MVLDTLRAVAETLFIVLPAPVTFTAVAPPVALNPTPDEVLMTSPPLEIVIVAPVLESRLTALFVVVVKLLEVPENVFVPPPQFCTRMPVPVEVILPEKVTLPLS